MPGYERRRVRLVASVHCRHGCGFVCSECLRAVIVLILVLVLVLDLELVVVLVLVLILILNLMVFVI